jgi:hypothetical protein
VACRGTHCWGSEESDSPWFFARGGGCLSWWWVRAGVGGVGCGASVGPVVSVCPGWVGRWGVGLLFEIWIVDASILQLSCVVGAVCVAGGVAVCFVCFVVVHALALIVAGVCLVSLWLLRRLCVGRVCIACLVRPGSASCVGVGVGVGGVGGVCDKL